MTELSGEAVVITGAGQGLGEGFARAAAAAGAGVVVNDINPQAAHRVAAEIRRSGAVAVAAPGDVADPAVAAALIDRCITEFGFVSGLVNNAGLRLRAPATETTLDDLQAMLAVNVVGVFNCARAAMQPMIARGGGSIVNLTSGAQTGQPEFSAYGATKGAVSSFTYGWACELKAHGVRVNALSPMAATPMAADTPGQPPVEANLAPLLYLLSKRSVGVTGQVLRIIGGRLSLMAHPANRAPVLQREGWTVESVAAAFEETLFAHQLPTDVATYDIARIT